MLMVHDVLFRISKGNLHRVFDGMNYRQTTRNGNYMARQDALNLSSVKPCPTFNTSGVSCGLACVL